LSTQSLGNVVIAIQAIDEASGVFGTIQASMGLLGGALSQLGPGFTQLGSIIQGFAAGGIAGAAIMASVQIVKGLQDSVKAAADSQSAWVSLQSTLHLTGSAWDDMHTKLSTVVDKLRETTTFSDIQLVGALQRMASFGMSSAQAMDALGTAAELAAAKHIDLDTAATALGKAFDGNTMLLRRYGVEVSTISQETTLAKEAIKELGDKIQTATGPQIDAFTAAMKDAGLSVDDATGKLKSHAQIVKELETAWTNGSISADQLSAITATLGLNFQGAKVHAADFAGTLGQVNAQYGGAAEAQAETYAGLQERLGNAWTTLSEKIGTLLLPALSSILEKMIPVVDAFGKGVDAIQVWLAEVAKIPEVKSTLDALGEAWSGLEQWFQDAANTVTTVLGPALSDLWGSLKELWDAVKPLFDAFKELWDALTGGGPNVDVFRLLVQALALQIMALAEAIKLVAPYIKAFADTFKAAADAISPVLKQIRDAITTFLSDLKTAFQDFYNWLIGASLWTDMWDQVLAVTGQMVAQLLSDLQSKLFDKMTDAFQTVTQGVQDIWNKSWQAIQTAFESVIGQIQTSVNTNFDNMRGFITENMGQYAPIANGALNAIWFVIDAGLALVKGDWQGALNNMHDALNAFWSAIQDATSAAFSALEAAFTGAMTAFEGILSGGISTMESAWSAFASFIEQGLSQLSGSLGSAQSSVNTTVASMESTVATTTSSIQSTLASTWNAITTGAQNLWNALVGHSIWTDMLATMESQTKGSMANILDTFVGGFGNITPAVPSTAALAKAGLGAPLSQPATTQQQAITIPITVTLDGQVLTKTVKKTLIEQRQYGARSVGGYT
jgi:phage-related protein